MKCAARTLFQGTSTNADIGEYGMCHSFEGCRRQKTGTLHQPAQGTFEGCLGKYTPGR